MRMPLTFVPGEGTGNSYSRQPQRTANCLCCGRFCKSSSSEGYDGNFDQIYLTTYCAQCGENTESMI